MNLPSQDSCSARIRARSWRGEPESGCPLGGNLHKKGESPPQPVLFWHGQLSAAGSEPSCLVGHQVPLPGQQCKQAARDTRLSFRAIIQVKAAQYFLTCTLQQRNVGHMTACFSSVSSFLLTPWAKMRGCAASSQYQCSRCYLVSAQAALRSWNQAFPTNEAEAWVTNAQVGPLRVLGSQTSRLTNGTILRGVKAEAEHPLPRGTDLVMYSLTVPMLQVKGFLFLSSIRRNDRDPGAISFQSL